MSEESVTPEVTLLRIQSRLFARFLPTRPIKDGEPFKEGDIVQEDGFVYRSTNAVLSGAPTERSGK